MRKRRTVQRILCLLLLCVMVFTPVASQAANSKFAVNYVRDSTGTRVGIKDVIIDDMTYYDVYGGGQERLWTCHDKYPG